MLSLVFHAYFTYTHARVRAYFHIHLHVLEGLGGRLMEIICVIFS